MGGPAWTSEEKTIVRTQYPLRGPAGTRRALNQAGYDRTLVAIKYRAHILGAQRDTRTWTPRELAILHRYYPHTGINGVKAALAAKGHHRTAQAIKSRASLERVKLAPPPAPAAPPPRRSRRKRRVAGQKLTPKQRAVLAAIPYGDLLDADDPPPTLRGIAVRQVARTLQARRLVQTEGKGLYRLTLAGIPAWRELTRGDDA